MSNRDSYLIRNMCIATQKTPESWKLEDVKRVLAATNPGKVTAAGQKYKEASRSFNDAAAAIESHIGQLKKVWGGDASEGAVKQFKQLQTTATNLGKVTAQAGAALETHGSEYLGWYKDHAANLGPGWIRTGGDDEAAREFLDRANVRVAETFNGMPLEVSKDLPDSRSDTGGGDFLPTPDSGGGTDGGNDTFGQADPPSGDFIGGTPQDPGFQPPNIPGPGEGGGPGTGPIGTGPGGGGSGPGGGGGPGSGGPGSGLPPGGGGGSGPGDLIGVPPGGPPGPGLPPGVPPGPGLPPGVPPGPGLPPGVPPGPGLPPVAFPPGGGPPPRGGGPPPGRGLRPFGPGGLPPGGGGLPPGGILGGGGPGGRGGGALRPGGPGGAGFRGVGPGGVIGARQGVGGMPMGAGAGGGSDEQELERTTWLVEDDDVWQDHEDVPPPVIG